MSLWYTHQEREVMTSSPQIPLLELSILTFPLPFPNLFPFFLSSFPPFDLSGITSPLGPPYDMNRIVFAWVSRGVTIVSVHWRLHPITIEKERASETFPNSGFLGDTIVGEKLRIVTASIRVLACSGHPQYM